MKEMIHQSFIKFSQWPVQVSICWHAKQMIALANVPDGNIFEDVDVVIPDKLIGCGIGISNESCKAD